MQICNITIETTNTPSILKFVANTMLTDGSFEYNTVEDATNSNLVQQLFHLPFIKKVFVTANFMAIERYNIIEWEDVQDELQQVIENYLNKNGSIFNNEDDTKKMPVQIYAESTPNPSVMKFVTNKLLTSQNIEVLSIEQTKGVPLATALFNFPFVKEIFISENYVSITKTESIDWFEIINEIRSFLKNYLEGGKSVVDEDYTPSEQQAIEQEPVHLENLDDISKEIIAILDEYIKPAVASDGGNIMFQSYDTNSKTVNVILQGACSGCPSSTITLKNGIEATLKQLLPNKIEEVVAING
ncbi:MAG: NifU family protein [Flavobacteriaceae bacterium]|nr:NifU family protein [Flavobacteriaceae bacterium]